MFAVAALGACLLVLVVVVFARATEAASWRRDLHVYELVFPRTITADQLSAAFTSLGAITHRPNWSLLPLPPIVLETRSTGRGISYYLRVSPRNEPAVLASLRAALPGLRLTESAPTSVNYSAAWEATLTSRQRPLAVDRTDAVASALLTSLQPVLGSATVTIQLILTSAGTPPPVKNAAGGSSQPLAWLIEGETPVDAEAVGQLRKKYETPVASAVLRLGVAGADRATAHRLAGRTWSGLQALNAPGVRVVRRYLPNRSVARRMNALRLPLLRWPLLLNSRELAAVSALPTGALYLPGLQLGAARQLPPPLALPRRGQVLGVSNYPGQLERPLAISQVDRTRHAWWLGPTGSGKSTLMASAIAQDIAEQRGVICIDVKGDLISEICARIGPEDQDRVIVIEPSSRTRPVGLNVLRHGGGEAERELAVDNVVHIFREIWKGFWGPRTDMVMRAGLSTLTLAATKDGEPYTLVELSPLLTNPAFRRGLLARTSLPPDLRAFWQRYEAMSEGERVQVIGPTLNKLDAFVSRTPIRLLLGQSSGIDLTDIFTKKKAVLVSLEKGALGAETTALAGALIVASLWQATLTRSRLPQGKRRPAFAYIDEAQDIVRLPLAIADMLAQARGYGLGITLANQYASQLPKSVLDAILGTVRTQLCFALDYDDARLLERRFAPLTADDLQGLQAYEIAVRPCVGGQTLTPVTGRTLPLPEPLGDPRAVAAASAARYGVDRAAVEQAMQDRLTEAGPVQRFGREPRP